MEKNAMAVVAMLEKLYQDHSSTMTSDFVVIGPSMGAPIARYALAWAEKNGVNLHSRLYIAFDGALQGASIPIGLQQLIRFAYKTKIGKKLEASSPLNCNAAKQLLVHHYSSNVEVPTPHRYFDIFQQNLKSIGYPANTRNVAIINGSKSADQTTTSASQEAMAVRVDARWPFGDIMRVKMFAGSATGRNRSLNLYIWNPIGKMVGAPPEETGYSEPYVSGYSYDVIPGGYSDTYKQIYDAAVGGLSEFYASNLDPWGGKQPRVKIGEIFGIDIMQNIPIAKKRFYFSKSTDLHSFVPTTSGVDFISNTTQRTLFYNWANEDIVCNGKTPFNAVYAPVANQAHVEITAENSVWFENEIKGSPYPGTGNNYTITGPDTFCGSQLYSINNLPSGATVNWSVSPSGIASTSPSGNSVTLTRIADGSVTLTASVNSVCGNMSISKSITVGLPALSVSSYVDQTPQPNNYQYLNATATQLPGSVTGDYTWYEEVNGLRGAWIASGLQLSNYPIPPCSTVYYQCVANTSCGEAVYRGYAYNSNCGGYAVSSSLVAYPNPASTELNISNTEETGKKEDAPKDGSNPEFLVRLYNEKGNILRSAKNPKGSKGIKLNIIDIPNGTYYLHISKGKEFIRKQIIIQH